MRHVVDNINHVVVTFQKCLMRIVMESLPPVGEALFGLLHVYKRALRESFQAAGLELTVSHIRVLKMVAGSENITAQQIASRMQQDKGLMTRLIRDLHARTLIDRRPHPTDSRAFHLTLTAEGRALYQRVVCIERALQARMVGNLTPHQLDNLIHTLSAMAEHLDHPQEDA